MRAETVGGRELRIADSEIRPTGGWRFLDLRELWEYRELVWFCVWRDVKVLYKQTVIGAAWAILQPFFVMVVFSLFLGKFAKIPSDGVPYPVFVFSARLPWTYFSNTLSNASNRLASHQNMSSKVYFPRIILPLSSVLGGLVDLVIACSVLGVMMVRYKCYPGIEAVWAVPLFVLLAMLTSFSVSLWLSALNVRYRDVRYVLGFLTQLWLFATPVAYPLSIVPEKWRGLYGLNPMVGVVEGFRCVVLGREVNWESLMGVSVAVVALLLVSGIFYFRKTEQTFADVV